MASKKGDVVHAAFEKAGARLSRKVSFVRRSNDVVTMTNVEQAEYFLRAFCGDEHSNVTRALVKEMLTSFVRFDKGKKGYLEEDEAMMMLESRSETKTFAQMRNAVRDIDLHAKRNLSFLEWACGVFDKSWIVLHTVKNVEVTPAMLAEMEALMEGLEEAEAAAEAANEVSLRAKSMRIKQQALAAIHEETHAAAKEEEGVAKAHVAADVAKQHKVFSAAATAAMAARADDAAVKHKMAAFKALDKALQTKHMTNEERIKFEVATRKKAKAEKMKLKKAKKMAKKAEKAEKQAQKQAQALEDEIHKVQLMEEAVRLDEAYKKKLAAADALAKAEKAKRKAERKAARKRLKAKAKAFMSKPATKGMLEKKKSMAVILGSQRAAAAQAAESDGDEGDDEVIVAVSASSLAL